MKKIILSLLVSIITISTTYAQSPIDMKMYNIFEKFENINTVIDPRTKKERAMTDEELKNSVVIEMTERLKKAGSTRIVQKEKVSVLPKMVLVPLIEYNGNPFYTVIISRETGKTNNEYASEVNRKSTQEKHKEWEDNVTPTEKDFENLNAAVAKYRLNNPKQEKQKKLSPSQQQQNMYKPKAPARKIKTIGN